MKADHAVQDRLQNAVWLRWLLLAFFMISWVLIVISFPVYFQRDDAKELYWSQHHSFIQAFIPTVDNALWHDGMYRPFREGGYLLLYKLFGLNSYGYHFALGLLLILTLVFLFKLAARIGNYATAYIMVFVWLGAFQFLLTNVFWFADLPHLVEIALISSGLYLFISGLGKSAIKTASGLALVLLAFLAKEPAMIIGPTAISVYLATNGVSRFLWGPRKTASLSILVLLTGPAYVAAFPYGFRRFAAGNASTSAAIGDLLTKFHFYGGILTSGLTGLALLLPAMCYLAMRLVPAKNGKVSGMFPYAMAASGVMVLAIMKLHWSALGIVILFAGALAIPRDRYFLLPWAFLPLAALCSVALMVRTYLYESSFALAMLAAIQAQAVASQLIGWWNDQIRIRALSYMVVALLVLCGSGLLTVKLGKQAKLLRLRSDSSMLVSKITPVLCSLPAGSILVTIDYESLGYSDILGHSDVLKHSEVMRLPDEQKVLLQTPMQYPHSIYWLKVIGKTDTTMVEFRNYQKNPDEYHRHSPVFLWLQTKADHDFLAKQNLITRPFGSATQGEAKSEILELPDFSRRK